MADTTINIGSTGIQKKLHENTDGTFSDVVYVVGTGSDGPLYAASTITIGTNDGVQWTKHTPATTARRVTIRNQDSTDYMKVATIVMHKTPDAAAWASTVPAVSEAESYALSIEIMADFNTHTASTVFHATGSAAVSSVAATSEATLKAQTVVARNAMIAHFASTTLHGGVADTANGALVAATSAAPADAAAAIVLENLLYQYFASHVAITSAGVWEKLPAGISLIWQSPETPVWFQLEANGAYSIRTDT